MHPAEAEQRAYKARIGHFATIIRNPASSLEPISFCEAPTGLIAREEICNPWDGHQGDTTGTPHPCATSSSSPRGRIRSIVGSGQPNAITEAGGKRVAGRTA